MSSFKVENLKRWSTYCCILPGIPEYDYQTGVSLGVLDGLVQTLFFIYDIGSGLHEAKENDPFSLSWWGDAIQRCYKESSFVEGFKSKIGDTYAYWKGVKESVGKILNLVNWSTIYNGIKSSLNAFLGAANPIENGLKGTGYVTGILAFEVILTALTTGGGSIRNISSFSKSALNSIKNLSSPTAFKNLVAQGLEKSTDVLRKIKLKILMAGCFVKGTPVLMANKNYLAKSKTYAVAAAMPFIVVPIQEVQLLDYALAHTTVNNYELKSEDNLIASTDEDYHGLINNEDSHPEFSRKEDPYTSDQQRQRDQYELDDENWHEVIFKQVNGSSTAKLALHNDWINRKGYRLDAVVNLNLPEQGISGPFRITSIKHIIPQKQPTDDDENDDYDYRPVTALITHVSDQVYNIEFVVDPDRSGGNNVEQSEIPIGSVESEQLGVTYQHPIYSVTAGDWRLAGQLEVGERVLTYHGESTVTSTEKQEASEIVYNLEVRELHNFLVGESGVVVHNSCPGVKKTLVLPNVFQNWINTLKTQLNPRRNFDDGKFEKHATGDDIQYEAIGGGEKIWADGIGLDRNALVDAKHNPGDFYTLESYLEKPFLYGA